MEKGKTCLSQGWGSSLFSHPSSPGLINLELKEYDFFFVRLHMKLISYTFLAVSSQLYRVLELKQWWKCLPVILLNKDETWFVTIMNICSVCLLKRRKEILPSPGLRCYHSFVYLTKTLCPTLLTFLSRLRGCTKYLNLGMNSRSNQHSRSEANLDSSL